MTLRTWLLILAALCLPLLWGWFSHWIMRRLWPTRPRDDSHDDAQTVERALDYQI